MSEILSDTSVAESYRFIKEFDFATGLGHEPFSELIFSDPLLIRLDRRDFNVKLRKLAPYGYYSTDDDIYFMTWLTNPKALRKILMLQVFVNRPSVDCSTQVRIHDGTNHYFWNGAAWAVAVAGDWNDEGTFNAHIQDFDILPDRQFAIVVNLRTSDKYMTPSVSEIRVLMDIRIDYMEDIVFRSLIPLMKQHIRPLANYPIPAYNEDILSIDLNDYETNTNFTIVDVEAVFNHSLDPEFLVNLLDSYDPVTKIITLTDPIVAGEIPFILFRYSPEVAYTTSQDYFEVAKIPCLTLQRLEVPTENAYNLAAREGIVDKGTGNAVLIHEPWRATLDFRLHVTTDNAVDEMRLISSVLKFFDEHVLIRSIGLDEYYRMQIIRELRDLISPNRADQKVFWTRFVISDVRMPFVSEDTKGVIRRIFKFSEPVQQQEDPSQGGKYIVFKGHTEDDPKAWEESFEITE
jgi:hypothetical protein